MTTTYTSIIRKYIQEQTDEVLWELFEEMGQLEQTSVSPAESRLRVISLNFFKNDHVLSMVVVGQEVWRELAVRYNQKGKPQ